MVRLRWAGVAVLLACMVATVGCGRLLGSQSTPEDGLDVLMTAASLRQARGITVDTLPVGTLRSGALLPSLVPVHADVEVSAVSLAFFEGLAQRDGGGAELGVTGICGYGWTDDGDQIDQDPCSAATPATQIPAGEAYNLHLTLYPVASSGPVTPGTYRITVPLNDPGGPLLDLTYRVMARGEAELPRWSDERIPLTLGFETSTAGVWPGLMVRIEDGYGRLIDERTLARYKDANLDMENDGVYTVDVPRRLPLHIVALRRDGDDWKPCGGGLGFVTTREKWPQTLLLGDCEAT